MDPHTPTTTPPEEAGGANTPPTTGFTCGGCDATWSGYSMAHCATCHYTFGSVKSFDRHRDGGTCSRPIDIGLTWNGQRRCWSEEYRGQRGA